MKRDKIKIAAGLLLVSSFFIQAQEKKYLSGTLQEFGPFGKTPARSVKVSILRKEPSGSLVHVAGDVWTSADGRFSFLVPPGNFILRLTKINPRAYTQMNKQEKPLRVLDYGIQVYSHNKGTNLNPIVIHQLRFKQNLYRFSESRVSFEGIYNCLPHPPTVYTWLVLAKNPDPNNAVIFPGKVVNLLNDTSWRCQRLSVSRDVKKAFVILVTKKSHQMLLKATETGGPVNFLQLTAYKLAEANLQIQ